MKKACLAALLVAAMPGLVRAEGCKLGKLAELPVTMVGRKPLVHAGINGKDYIFLADSGAYSSFLTPSTVAESKLATRTAPADYWVSTATGYEKPEITTVSTFTLAGVPISDLEFLVKNSEVAGAAGLMGQNILALYDTEFDLAGGMIRMMRSEGCGKVGLAYWRKAGEGYSQLQTEPIVGTASHIVGTVLVNGVHLRAMFDTGAPVSEMTLEAAAKVGLKPDGPRVVAGGSWDDGTRRHQTWIGTVAKLKIGDEEIANARMRFGKTIDTGFDMIIGADFFLSHHIYYAPKLRLLYFTYNGGPIFNLSTGSPAAEEPVAQVAGGDEPKDAASYARRGTARLGRGDPAGALADLDRAVSMDPDNPEYFRQRASAYQSAGKLDASIADIEKLVKLKPDDVQGHLLLAVARRGKGDIPASRAEMKKAEKGLSPASDQQLSVAEMLSMMDDYEGSIPHFVQWLAVHPRDTRAPTAYNSLCWARAVSGKDLPAALKECDAALDGRPGEAAFFDSRALVYLRLGEVSKAIADYDAALAKKKFPDSYYGRGLAHLRQGQKAEGEADLAQARKIDPGVAERFKQMGLTPGT
jgi:tetratricopeptide (TPR) repeat protein/predicted aspartyl protease